MNFPFIWHHWFTKANIKKMAKRLGKRNCTGSENAGTDVVRTNGFGGIKRG